MSETGTTTTASTSPHLKLVPLPVDLALPYSQSPDIIRSNQRDIQYSLTFSEQYKNFLLQLLGNRWLNKNQNLVDLSSKFIYYSLTTLLLDQTLGEEYCEILPFRVKKGKLPSFMNRSLSILLYCSFPTLIEHSIKPLKTKILKLTNSNENLSEKVKSRINWVFQDFIPIMIKFLKEYALPLHLVIFYFKGSYYHLSKRLTGIRYISANKPANPIQGGGGGNSYEILGILLGIQLLVKLGLQLKKSVGKWKADLKLKVSGKSENEESGEDVESIDGELNNGNSNEKSSTSNEVNSNQIQLPSSIDGKCALCLSVKTNPTCTPCGHIFCWECISEWCRTKPECPLCRQNSGLSQLWTIRI